MVTSLREELSANKDRELDELRNKIADPEKPTSFLEQNFIKFFQTAMVQWEDEREQKNKKKSNFVIYG